MYIYITCKLCNSVQMSKQLLYFKQTKDSKTTTVKEPSPSTSTSQSTSESGKAGGLSKWKGVLFLHGDEEGGESTEDLVESGELDSSFRKPVGTSGTYNNSLRPKCACNS